MKSNNVALQLGEKRMAKTNIRQWKNSDFDGVSQQVRVFCGAQVQNMLSFAESNGLPCRVNHNREYRPMNSHILAPLALPRC